MKLLVTGSRNIDDMSYVFSCLLKIMQVFDFDTIIEGDAIGVDRLAGLFAVSHGMKLITRKPEWRRYGKRAGLIRNTEMVILCDKGIAIWDGKSRGTKHCINELRKAKKLLKIFYHEK